MHPFTGHIMLGLLVYAFSELHTPCQSYAAAWLENDPSAVWERPPGFYKQGNDWYAIIHVKPDITRVRLGGDFSKWETNAVELTKTPDGKFWWFKGGDGDFLRPPKSGDRYQFFLEKDGKVERWQDPAARRTEHSNPHGNSLVTISAEYQWHDSAWSRPGWDQYLIYQLHPLRFTNRNSGKYPLQQITEELNGNGSHDYLNDLQITAVQLLPVNEFFGDKSWGYNPSFFYAIETSYGLPDHLKELVDTAHQNGIAVVLDVVLNHAGNSDNILWAIAQEDHHHGTYFDGDTRWGPLVNFDNDIAKHFFTQNLVYLAREYHIDGFRFDFTRPIHNADDWNITDKGSGGGWQFLRELRQKLKSVHPGILMIAEELPNTWQVTSENVGDAWAGDVHGPFDSQWTDLFHDKLKEVLTGTEQNCVFLDCLKSVFTDFGDSWQDALLYSESHDEVGNMDDRIPKRARDGKGWEMSQLAATATILSKGIPMIFMGQEGGETKQFGQNGDSWWNDRLPIEMYQNDVGMKKVWLWYQKMFDIRLKDKAAFSWKNIVIAHVHNDNGIVAFTRDRGKYVVILNFKGTAWDHYNVGISGNYEELANSSWPVFNLGATTEKTRAGGHAFGLHDVLIPGYGAVVLVRSD